MQTKGPKKYQRFSFFACVSVCGSTPPPRGREGENQDAGSCFQPNCVQLLKVKQEPVDGLKVTEAAPAPARAKHLLGAS